MHQFEDSLYFFIVMAMLDLFRLSYKSIVVVNSRFNYAYFLMRRLSARKLF